MSLITTTKELKAFCKELEDESFITVDTEFLRDKTYFPKLCLIQVAGKNTSYAIDNLAEGIDLQPLYDLLTNSSVLKVFHSARQDIEIIYNLTGKVPSPLFDSQVAAMVCGFGEAASYEALVRKLASVSLDKSSRFTDWSNRPLTQKQLDYALSDVIHLRTVYKALQEKLEENGRTHWLAEEMETLTNPENYEIRPEDAWKKLRIRSGQSLKFVKRVQELAKWREEIAQKKDLPRNHVVKEQTLLEIAASAPKTVKSLKNIRGLGRMGDNSSMVKDILQVIEEVATASNEDLEQCRVKKKAPSKSGALVELLKVLLKMKSDEHNVAVKLIASTDDLALVAADDNAAVPALHGWRYEVFGQYAKALKEGKIALAAKGNHMKIVDIS